MKTISQATTRELEIEQLRRRIKKGDAELMRITSEVLPGMMKKQAARRQELGKQEMFTSIPPVNPVSSPAS